MLPSKTPAEIFVFGAVFVNANPYEYVKFAFDMNRLQRLPSYRGAGRFRMCALSRGRPQRAYSVKL